MMAMPSTTVAGNCNSDNGHGDMDLLRYGNRGHSHVSDMMAMAVAGSRGAMAMAVAWPIVVAVATAWP